eukprot:CAMPEP_0196582900 /NCGR_PEP_ID=MMETSP1081-20130531/41210_1 /TAXON_ID=36882 /ORGANISM="Pyramimonas amylifera, Strain CCMP720" /LENGTH=223 /DNA_ID=CAMNT_0041903621 /DNA_START=76 /DNA_END=747 /DNA_ORIENTATION=-
MKVYKSVSWRFCPELERGVHSQTRGNTRMPTARCAHSSHQQNLPAFQKSGPGGVKSPWISNGSEGAGKQRESVVVRGFLGGLAKFITGDAAKLSMKVEEASLSAPFKVTVRASASSEVSFSKVYLKVRCSEEINNFYLNISDYSGWINESEQTVNFEIDIAGAGELKEGQNAEWECMVEIPEGSQPSFSGKYIENRWTLLAGLATGLKGGVNPTVKEPLFLNK